MVLVVQEISGKFGGTGVWKMPTGVVDEGEDICDAAIREVKEETGVLKLIEVKDKMAFSSSILLWNMTVRIGKVQKWWEKGHQPNMREVTWG
ncbi:Nucleoside diphosphate-linked moiety X motif 6 [Trifolium repens]|nr:Nucleoside diphosphate-linked moiety X motif 6 [Trifolium repens]